jgi:hypothetical protein
MSETTTTTTTTTIPDFLRARIAEDEATAKAAAAGEALLPSLRSVKASAWVPDGEITHIARWDPARVLAECEARRRIVEWCGERDRVFVGAHFGGDAMRESDFLPGALKRPADSVVLRALAAVYADHPDYDQAWRP